jgi:hypothetical protein
MLSGRTLGQGLRGADVNHVGAPPRWRQNPAIDVDPRSGYSGQHICVDPISDLVVIQMALDAPGADFKYKGMVFVGNLR